MALTTTVTVKALLGISAASVAEDAWLDALRDHAEVIVKEYTARDFERQNYTEYYDGTGTRYLTLRQRPVTPVTRAATRTSGSTLVTGLTDTADLLVGMAVAGTGIPAGTTVAALTSATSVTLSAAVTASGTSTLVFGLAAWSDWTGYHGHNPTGAFAATTALTFGTDFGLDFDKGGTTSRSGLLIRFDTSWSELDYRGRPGVLLQEPGASFGSVKVAYTAGYQTIPKDIQAAVAYLVAFLKRTMPLGADVHSERIGGYSYELVPFMLRRSEQPELGTARQLLSRYKEPVF